MSEKPRVSPEEPRAKSASSKPSPTREAGKENLPEVSRQTAGGIAGAMVGGVVAGPLGAIVGGVAGALIGNASAQGKRPVGRTVDSIREVTEEPARKAYASIKKAVSSKKTPAKKTPGKKATAKKTAVKKKSDNTKSAIKPPAKKTTKS